MTSRDGRTDEFMSNLSSSQSDFYCSSFSKEEQIATTDSFLDSSLDRSPYSSLIQFFKDYSILHSSDYFLLSLKMHKVYLPSVFDDLR